MTHNWYNAADNSGRKGAHAIFIDFRKAHNILLEKLTTMNVNKSFWLWIKSYLSHRTQQVNLDGILSSTQPCPCQFYSLQKRKMWENSIESVLCNHPHFADTISHERFRRRGIGPLYTVVPFVTCIHHNPCFAFKTKELYF